MGPYDSLREYAAAMEQQGQLMRIREMDQDRYEMTAFGYRLDDRMRSKAPAFIVERTKINDRWYETPVISNVLNSYRTVAQALGAEGVSDEESSNYTAAVSHIMSFLDADHRWAKIDPVVVERSAAPCKEVILTGDDADLYRFPWIRNNPADGG
jgi:4-hydroxy-3-polyprenylbenzoate decarboxylase